MRSEILDDSEDEEIDLLSSGPQQQIACATHTANDETLVIGHSVQHSTGSTERLRKQIREAECALREDSTSRQASTVANRSTEHSNATLLIPPAEQNVHRSHSRTEQHQSSNMEFQPSSDAAIGEAFWLPSENGQVDAPVIASHSQIPSIPTEVDDQMFGGPLSTIPDGEATQQRLVEDILQRRAGNTEDNTLQSTMSIFDQAENAHSSSVLYNSARLEQMRAEQQLEDDQKSDLQLSAEIKASDENINIRSARRSQVKATNALDKHIVEEASSGNLVLPVATSHKSESKPVARKRKAAEVDLSSEGLLVGLPPEKYVPRPTKRRATAIPVQSQDQTTTPQKAGKLSRRKTTDVVLLPSTLEEPVVEDQAAQSTAADVTELEPEPEPQPKSEPRKTGKAKKSAKKQTKKKATRQTQTNEEEVAVPAIEENNASSTRSKMRKGVQDVILEQSSAATPAKSTAQSRSKARKSAIQVLEDTDDEVDENVEQKPDKINDQDVLQEIQNQAIHHSSTLKRRTSAKAVTAPDDEGDELASSEHLIASETRIIEGRPPELATEPDDPRQTLARPFQAVDRIDMSNVVTSIKRAEDYISPVGTKAEPDSDRAAVKPGSSLCSPPTSPPPKEDSESPRKHDKQEENVDAKTGKAKKDVKAEAKTIGNLYRVGLSRTHRIPSLLKIVRPPKK